LHFPGLCRFLCSLHNRILVETPTDEAWQGKKDRFGTNASQDATLHKSAIWCTCVPVTST
jgi:hypothetical protein